MNQKILFSRIKTSKVYTILLIFVSLTIPLSVSLNNIAVGLLIIYWLVTGNIKIKIKLLVYNKFFWLFASIYLIQFIGILYSTDIADALSKLEKKAGLLLLPFLLLSMPTLKLKQVFWIIFSFALSSFGLVAYAIFQIFTSFRTLLNVPQITEKIDDIIQLHHAYSGLYLVFSICSLVYILVQNWHELHFKWRISTIVLILGLYGVLIILGARMALFISFFVLGLQMLLFTIELRRFSALALIAITAVISLVGILRLPSTRSKLNEFIFFKGVYHPFTPRLIQWQCCIDIVNENNAWVQGVGTGDVKPLLQACYQRKKFWGELYHYNSHNEYLEELLRHGLVGLTLLLMALGIPLMLTIKRRQYLYSCFLIIFMFACLSEAILNRQKGVIFYAFFNSVLFMSSFSEKKNDLVIIDSKYSKKI
jgi:O-antigen ligase